LRHADTGGRYLYVPLGGSRTYLYNIWVIFTFVALWHDMTMQARVPV
jgi:D-alanyl-lipoteichoic acid acyltransferase DltB (MBOAT superfamily)